MKWRGPTKRSKIKKKDPEKNHAESYSLKKTNENHGKKMKKKIKFIEPQKIRGYTFEEAKKEIIFRLIKTFDFEKEKCDFYEGKCESITNIAEKFKNKKKDEFDYDSLSEKAKRISKNFYFCLHGNVHICGDDCEHYQYEGKGDQKFCKITKRKLYSLGGFIPDPNYYKNMNGGIMNEPEENNKTKKKNNFLSDELKTNITGGMKIANKTRNDKKNFNIIEISKKIREEAEGLENMDEEEQMKIFMNEFDEYYMKQKEDKEKMILQSLDPRKLKGNNRKGKRKREYKRVGKAPFNTQRIETKIVHQNKKISRHSNKKTRACIQSSPSLMSLLKRRITSTERIMKNVSIFYAILTVLNKYYHCFEDILNSPDFKLKIKGRMSVFKAFLKHMQKIKYDIAKSKTEHAKISEELICNKKVDVSQMLFSEDNNKCTFIPTAATIWNLENAKQNTGGRIVSTEDLMILIYFKFLTQPPFINIIKEDNGTETSIKDKKVEQFAKSYYGNETFNGFFTRTFSMVKSLCPGKWRLMMEANNIYQLCSTKFKNFNKLMKNVTSNKIIPNMSIYEDYLKFDPYSYKLNIYDHVSDVEIFDIVKTIHYYWRLCKFAMKESNKKFGKINEAEVSLAILYEMVKGVKDIRGLPVYMIMKHPLISKRSFIVVINCISNYEYTRKNRKNGHDILMACFNYIKENYPLHIFIPHLNSLAQFEQSSNQNKNE